MQYCDDVLNENSKSLLNILTFIYMYVHMYARLYEHM